MALAHPLHPIRNRSINKRQNLWFGRCVATFFWSKSLNHVNSMSNYGCILITWNQLLLKDIFLPLQCVDYCSWRALSESVSVAVNGVSWFCRLCNERIFPFNHIKSDNELTVTLYQFMGYALIPGAEFQPPDQMIFDPFDIYELEDQIIEYHGELDPDSNYFNQFSHRLYNSSNYYVEDSFNKYIKRNCHGRIFFLSFTPISGVFQPT